MIFEDGNFSIVSRSLRANFSWTFAGNIIYAICNWATLVALAKFGTPQIVGRFALGLAVTAPIFQFTNLQLRTIQATDAQRHYLFRDYFGLRLLMLSLALIVIVGVVVASKYEVELALIVLIIGLDKAADAVSDVIYGLLQQHEQMDRIAKSKIMKAVLSLGLLVVGQYHTQSLLWATIGWCCGSVLVMAAYDLRSSTILIERSGYAQDSPTPRFKLQTLARLMWLALPLGITVLLISLNINVPRYFVERYLGEHGLGIFAALAFMALAGTNVTSALGQSAAPRLAQHYASGELHAFKNLLLKLMLAATVLGAAGVVVALVAGQSLLTIFYQPEYAMHNDVFVLLMMSGGISYLASFLGYGTTAARYFKLQPIILAVCVGAVTIVCAVLIPTQGIRGAAWATLTAYLLQLSLMGAYLTYGILTSSRQSVREVSKSHTA